jgi:hypothetical protein
MKYAVKVDLGTESGRAVHRAIQEEVVGRSEEPAREPVESTVV